jgi:coenzyme F420-reducing hydrogenase gamma subunit
MFTVARSGGRRRRVTGYARPEFIDTLATSTAIADHVTVDFELRGCPVSKHQLLELITATLAGRKPHIPRASQCMECKLNGTVCVMVANGTPCLGPVTQAGCGNLCAAHGRGCYGCFGPKESPNPPALSAQLRELGMPTAALRDLYRTYNAGAPEFNRESLSHD